MFDCPNPDCPNKGKTETINLEYYWNIEHSEATLEALQALAREAKPPPAGHPMADEDEKPALVTAHY